MNFDLEVLPLRGTEYVRVDHNGQVLVSCSDALYPAAARALVAPGHDPANNVINTGKKMLPPKLLLASEPEETAEWRGSCDRNQPRRRLALNGNSP